MARTDKQLSYEQRYQQKMQMWKDTYKTRTDFASKFKLDSKKAKGLSTETQIKEAIQNGGSTGSAEKVSDAASGTTVTVANASESAKKVLAVAQSLIGKIKYKFGASDPTTGYSDCSGFTSYVYKNAVGVDIGRSTDPQAKAGTLVNPRENAQPGDLILFQGTYRPGPSHVGIVYEWPKIIHCGGNDGDTNVQWAEVKPGNYYDKHFLSIRRILTDVSSSSTSSNKTTAKAMDVTTTTNEVVWDRTNEEGTESMSLNGRLLTSTPDAPPATSGPLIDLLSEIGAYKPITTNGTAGHIYISRDNRANWLAERIAWAKDTGFKYFDKLNPDSFVHIPWHDGFEGNLYSPDAIEAFEIFRLKCKREKLEILSGFRYSPEGLLSPHEAGCAIDVRVYGAEEARKLADIAWSCGFRAIAIGGDLTNETGFIHLDIGPKSEWGYDDIPAYKGPGRWSLT